MVIYVAVSPDEDTIVQIWKGDEAIDEYFIMGGTTFTVVLDSYEKYVKIEKAIVLRRMNEDVK